MGLDIVLNRRGGVPIRDQLVTQLELKILDGSLAHGQRLPSVRSLARQPQPGTRPEDSSTVYQDAWVRHLVERFGSAMEGGVAFYAIDNEPDLWPVTHTDVHPVQPSYDDMLNTYVEYADAIKDVDPAKAQQKILHATIKKVTEDIEREFHFNTAISALMELVNEMYEYTSNGVTEDKLPMIRAANDALTMLLAPFAPHFAEELWESLGGKGTLANAAWPQHDPGAIVATVIVVVVQVNGKVRSKLTLPAGTSDKDIETAALADAKVREFIAGKSPKKVIVVQGKLVSVVV